LKFATLQTVVKSVAKANTNTAYLNLGFDSLKLATVKLMDPLKRCMVTPDNLRTCLIEEARSTQDEELSKLLEYHLEKVELNNSLPFNAMLLVAHGTTSLFQSINTDGLTFSSLPYEVKGLKMITHQQKSALPRPQRAESSYFSEAEIQDWSTECLKERGLKQLRFHKNSSQHDWQCFINENDSKYVSMFGDSEHSVGRQPFLWNMIADTVSSSSISWLRLLNSLSKVADYTRAVHFEVTKFNSVKRSLVPSTFNRLRGNASPLKAGANTWPMWKYSLVRLCAHVRLAWTSSEHCRKNVPVASKNNSLL
jgi:hypothetical protein